MSRRDSHPLLLATEAERDWFMSKVEPEPMSGCWLWMGEPDKHGYGHVTLRRKFRGAHRVSLYNFGAKFDDDLVCDHLCQNPSCVNPDHLEAVTVRENTLRGVGPSAANAKKRRCHRGHLLDERNTYVCARGKRNCRKCHRDAQRRHVARSSKRKAEQ